jgi:membrane-bound lytic murein transglycosylase D
LEEPSLVKYLSTAFLLTLIFNLTGCATVTPSATGLATVLDAAKPAPQTASVAETTPEIKSGLFAPQAEVQRPLTPPQPYEGELSAISSQDALSSTVIALHTPTDLWDRIRRGFAMPDLQSDLVHDREQWYSSRPDYIFRMTERSRKYLFHIVEELELRNMPTELALLPFIESAFNPQAVSNVKAAGMWQFMPATGKYFELKQNAFRDDRRDVLASTRAALDYLQKLHRMFGDWHLALAAYNWGEGSVGRAIAKNQRAGLPKGYLELSMPMETRFYVPKLQAVKNIVAQPDAFNTKLPLIENHPYFQSVTIVRDIDVNLAAKLAEVPLDDFKALNPSINRPVILAAGTPQILLPWNNAEIFQNNLQTYTGGRLASWTVWIAPTTMRPADAAKRVGMSEADFRSVNAVPPRVVIRAGSSLVVPRANHIQHDVTVKVADGGQLSLSPEVVTRRTVLKAGKNDSVASVARKYRLDPAQVAQWNKANVNSSFKPGQSIVVYLATPAKAKAKAKSKSSAKSASKTAVKKPATPARSPSAKKR